MSADSPTPLLLNPVDHSTTVDHRTIGDTRPTHHGPVAREMGRHHATGQHR